MARTERTPLAAAMEEERQLGRKWCSGCTDFHPFEEFGPSRDRPDGLNPLCRVAAKEADRRNHAKRRGEAFRGSVISKDIKEAAPDGMTWCNIHKRYCPTDTFGKDPRKANGLQSSCVEAQALKKSAARNPPKRITSKYNPAPDGTRWCCWHKRFEPIEEFRAKDRLCRDGRRESQRMYPEANAAKERKRRATKKGAEGHHTKEQVLAIGESQGWICANPICQIDVRTKYDVDHKIPLVRGGSNWVTNLQILCPSCNRKKSDMDYDKWVTMVGVKLLSLP